MVLSKIVSPTIKEQETDWSKRQLVIHGDGSLLCTTGDHTEQTFKGVVISYPNQTFRIGESTNWQKSQFKPISEPITVTYENK